MKKRGLLSVVCAVLISAVMLTGCSLNMPNINLSGLSQNIDLSGLFREIKFPKLNFDFSKPKTADALIKKYLSKDRDNYSAYMTMSVNVKAGIDDEEFELPMDISMDFSVCGNYVHGYTYISGDIFTDGMSLNTEEYVIADSDGYKVYLHDDSQNVWYTPDSYVVPQSYIDIISEESSWKGADMVYDKESEQYRVSQKLLNLTEGDNSDAFEEMAQFLGTALGDDMIDDMMSAFEDVNVIYTFDKDYNLVEAEMDGMEYVTEFEEAGITYTFNMEMSMNCNFYDFGNIDEDLVRVPDEIVENALSEDEYNGGSFALGDDYDDYDYYDDSLATGEECVLPKASDALGSVNGKDIKEKSNSFKDTFGALGFTAVPDAEGDYSFLSFESSKYPDVYLSLFADADYDTPIDMNYIKKNGFTGYTISCYDLAKAPAMTFAGLTWGASPDDFMEVYGKPTYSSNNDSYAALSYDCGNVSLTFTFTDGKLDTASYYYFDFNW